jgi:hypothetical protein
MARHQSRLYRIKSTHWDELKQIIHSVRCPITDLLPKGSDADLGIACTAEVRPPFVGVSEVHRYSATEKIRKRDLFRYEATSERSIAVSDYS